MNKRKKQHNSGEKARANPCSDAITTHNQIRADLNRHRTQNHIKGNSLCIALHCSQSPLFSLSAPTSLILSLTFLHHFFLSFVLSVIIAIASRFFNASDLKHVLPRDLFGRFLFFSLILCFYAAGSDSAIHPFPGDKLCSLLMSQVAPRLNSNTLKLDTTSFSPITQIYGNGWKAISLTLLSKSSSNNVWF